jgi:hypothetical protein
VETHFTGRLGVAWLRPEDRILIKTMLQLHSLRHGISFAKPRWNLVTEAPYDAIVGDVLLLPADSDVGRTLSCPVLRIVPYGTDAEDADSIARPLTADTLYVWVTRVWEACAVARGIAPSGSLPEKIATGSPPVAASPKAGASPSAVAATQEKVRIDPPLDRVGSEPKAASPVAATVPTPPVPATAARAQDEQPQQSEQNAYYKLKRWPPTHLLQNDALNIRMASLLSRHPLQVRDLEWLTGVDLERCQRFVDALLEAGLLVLHQNAVETPVDSKVAASRVSALGVGAIMPSFSRTSRHSVAKEASAFLQKSLQQRGMAPAAGAVAAPLVSPSQGQTDVLPNAATSSATAHVPDIPGGTDHNPAPAASSQGFFRRGLIGSIRKKLGI